MAWETKMARGIKKMFNKTLQLKKREYGRTKCILNMDVVKKVIRLGLDPMTPILKASSAR